MWGLEVGGEEMETDFKDWIFWKILREQSFMKRVMVCDCSQVADDVEDVYSTYQTCKQADLTFFC